MVNTPFDVSCQNPLIYVTTGLYYVNSTVVIVSRHNMHPLNAGLVYKRTDTAHS